LSRDEKSGRTASRLVHIRANPTTETSTRISKDLKKRGWTFVGPTTVYAFMQAMGLVNDHIEGCVCRQPVELERKQFKRPAKRR
jgi:DNA-3-methyladenine glycosylase I